MALQDDIKRKNTLGTSEQRKRHSRWQQMFDSNASLRRRRDLQLQNEVMAQAQNNFFLWGAWRGKGRITKPFVTKKWPGTFKKVVFGESCVIGLTETGKVVSWGKDSKTGCLGLGDDSGTPVTNSDSPQEVPKLKDVMDIQMGLEHVVVLTSGGEVYVWGSGAKGQLGTGRLDTLYAPLKVEALTNEQIVQILVVRNSTFALSSNGTVFAWGDNQDSILGLEDGKAVEEWPTKLTLLQETRVRKLEVFDGKTIVAHIRGAESETNFGRYETVPEDGGQGEKEEIDIFKGIDEMREVMTKTQEWWNHLLNIKHGEPCELPEDVDVQAMQVESSAKPTSPDDSEVEVERLHRAERHLDALVHAARRELRELQKSHGSRKNSRFILCMFIDECRLRREKVKRTIAARRLKDAKARSDKISAYSVKDFSSKAEESINRLTEDRKKLVEMRDAVQAIVIPSSDVLSEQLQVTLLECLECKLQLLSTQLQLVKARNPDVFPQLEHRDPNLMLPALEIIKARWDSLKHFSLYALYMEESEKFDKQKQGIDDNTHLAYLVKASNAKIDTMLQIDKEPRLSHDSQVPGLCYDLLRENAELRKMANTYQLHVLMLYNGRDTDPSIGMTQADGQAVTTV